VPRRWATTPLAAIVVTDGPAVSPDDRAEIRGEQPRASVEAVPYV
jgi:hypothetical protein